MPNSSYVSSEPAAVALPDVQPDTDTIDFGAVVASADIGITLTATGSGRIYFANARFCAMIGYTSDELSGGKLSFVELTAPEDLVANVEVYQRFAAHEIDRFTIAKRYLRKDGSSCQARVTAVHVAPGADGEARTLGIIEEVPEAVSPALANAVCRQVDDYIARRIGEPFTIDQFAALAGVSPRAFFKHFKLSRGCAPSQYIKKARLARARALLQDGVAGRSVTGVAFACGFGNLGHFARAYRETFGEPPFTTLQRERFG